MGARNTTHSSSSGSSEWRYMQAGQKTHPTTIQHQNSLRNEPNPDKKVSCTKILVRHTKQHNNNNPNPPKIVSHSLFTKNKKTLMEQSGETERYVHENVVRTYGHGQESKIFSLKKYEAAPT